MKNTKIYLWLEPMIMDHQRHTGKAYFNCIIKGDHTKAGTTKVDDMLGRDQIIRDIMDFADIDQNYDYGVVSLKGTDEKESIEYAPSPEEIQKQKSDKAEEISKKKEEQRVVKFLNSKKEIVITKEDVDVKDGGKIEIKLPSLNTVQEIDFVKIWDTLEADIIGKIKDGDSATLTDDQGNVLFTIAGGSFLNVAHADLSIYNKKEKSERESLFGRFQGLKGGLYVRDDGSMCIGDMDRTFYMRIYTNRLLKASLRLGKNPLEIMNMKQIATTNKKK